jgi:hypothetical protein
MNKEIKENLTVILRGMSREAEIMARDFERNLGTNCKSIFQIQEAISSIASKQAAICGTLIELLK